MADEIPTTSTPGVDEELSDSSAILRHDTQARFWLAIVVLLQFVLLVGYISVRGANLPDSQLILGAEISFVTLVLQFFFGSSSGSVTKSASKSAEPAKP